MKSFRHTFIFAIMAVALVLPQGCSLLDENLEDCEKDHLLNYELRLVTNMSTEINTQLETDLSETILRIYSQTSPTMWICPSMT